MPVCDLCTLVNIGDLRAHVRRRHPESVPPPADTDRWPTPLAPKEAIPVTTKTLPPRDWREAQREAPRRKSDAADPRIWPANASKHYRDSWAAVSSEAYRMAWERWLKAPTIDGHGWTAEIGADANFEGRDLLVQVGNWQQFGRSLLPVDPEAQEWQEFRADQGVGSGSIGGYTVPPGFLQKLTVGLKRGSSMLRASTVVDLDSGDPLQWPTTDDTGNSGAILAENTAPTVQSITFGSKTLGAFMYTSLPLRVSFQLASDAFPAFPQYLGLLLGRRIGRAFNAHATNGTGGGTQPVGLVPNATTVATMPTGNTTKFTYDGVVDLIGAVDPEYLEPLDEPGPATPGAMTLGPHVGFMTSVAGLKALRRVEDTANNPIVTEGRPVTCLGYPVMVNPDVPVPAASARSLLFGAFGPGYIIRRSLNDVTILKLVERFGDQLQYEYLGFQRLDGAPDDGNAIRVLVNSAT
jgi:HK97 family phage major capsid protein